jgi:hypothetical protein
MDKSEIESLLRDHVRGVHAELERLFRGVERALNDHLAGTEKAISRALSTYDQRLTALEKRVASLEGRPG